MVYSPCFLFVSTYRSSIIERNLIKVNNFFKIIYFNEKGQKKELISSALSIIFQQKRLQKQNLDTNAL